MKEILNSEGSVKYMFIYTKSEGSVHMILKSEGSVHMILNKEVFIDTKE